MSFTATTVTFPAAHRNAAAQAEEEALADLLSSRITELRALKEGRRRRKEADRKLRGELQELEERVAGEA